MPRRTLDTICGIRLCQHEKGYRFSMDPVLLAAFVSAASPKRIIDLGSGAGIIGLLLAGRYPKARVTLVELQESLSSLAAGNIALNGMSDRVEAACADVRKFVAEGYDIAVSNPPFRARGSGRLCKGDERLRARHEESLTLEDLLRAASRALKARGRFYIVYHPERLAVLFDLMRGFRLEPKRMRFVHGRLEMQSRMVLVEAVRDGRPSLKVEPPLIIYRGETQEYTDEVAAMYGVSSSEK